MTHQNSDERLRAIAERRRGDAEAQVAGRLVVVVLVLVVVAAGGAGWWWTGHMTGGRDGIDRLESRVLDWYVTRRADRLTAPSTDASPVSFEVFEGENVASVGARLEAAGLVRDAGAFRMLARARGLDRGIQAGSHALRRDMNAETVLVELQVALGDQVAVTLPEGLRAEEVAAILAGKGLVDRDAFLALVREGDGGGRDALADRPAGAGLEGYLFPDTYALEPGAGADAVLDALLDNFGIRFTPEMRRAAEAADLSLFDVVTLASIVEREAVVPAERPRIARVYLNRLAEAPYLLNADPTVQYALGFQPDTNVWWKRPLLRDDLAVDSPYNSYTTPGLPPGPIASPGLASIEAVVAPAEGDWMYFVANDAACDGTHVFAQTYEEHLANVAAYQTGTCGR